MIYRYSVSMVTKNERKNYNWSFVTDNLVSEAVIKAEIERLCDVYVSKVSRVVEFELPKTIEPFFPLDNYCFSFVQKINGEKCSCTRQVLPRLKSNFDKRSEVESVLRGIIPDLTIVFDVRKY